MYKQEGKQLSTWADKKKKKSFGEDLSKYKQFPQILLPAVTGKLNEAGFDILLF